MSARRYILLGGWRPLIAAITLVCGLPSGTTAQSLPPFEHRLALPDNGGEYTVRLESAYRVEVPSMDDGAASTEGPAHIQVQLTFGQFTVAGPDASAADLVSMRIVLPDDIPGETIFLSAVMPEGSSLPFLFPAGEPLQGKALVTLSYAGREVDKTTIDLSQRFAPHADIPTPTQTEVAAAPPVVRTAPEKEPQPEPAYELDYRRMPPEAFIEAWPEQTTFVHRALARIPLRPEVEEVETGVYELRFRNVRGVRIDSVGGGLDYALVTNESDSMYGYRMVVEVRDTGVYRLHLSDSTKLQPRTEVTLDNLLKGTFAQSSDSAHFTFRGGHPPYMLLFLRDGVPVSDYELGNDTVWSVPLKVLGEVVGAPGNYSMQFTDSQRSVTWNFGGANLRLDRREKPVRQYRIPLYVAGGLLLLLLVYGIRNYRRRRRGNLIRRSLQQSPETASNNPRPAIESSVYPDRSRLGRTPATVPKGFRVTKRDVRDRFNGRFNPDDHPAQFLSLDLGELWEQSSVSELLFGKGAIGTLNAFLQRENIDKIYGPAVNGEQSWERNKDIPEIGGMLMGQYQPTGGGSTYRVSVEQFIPLAARVQNLVKMEIDPMSLARDLSQAQDDYPHLTVVGWFHTHPGHGLFLSQPDLKVQYNHFRKPYHVAMEIDSLTERLDTAFFTYMPDGRMNNQQTRRTDRSWFSWMEMETFSRHRTNTLP